VTVLDLNQLRQAADDWLRSQKPNVALCPCQVDYFRTYFCLPAWFVEALRRDDEKEAQR
jgi:hypothetical protein